MLTPSTHWYTKPDTPIILLGDIDKSMLEPLAACVAGNLREERTQHFPEKFKGIHWHQFPFFFRTYSHKFKKLHPALTTKYFEEISEIYDVCEGIFTRVEELNPGFSIYIADINYMAPGTAIKPHIDNEDGSVWWFTMTKRVHVPITTNADTIMTCGNMSMCMEIGSVYEFNNMVTHFGANNGSSSRTHVVIDLIPTEYFDEFENYIRTIVWKKNKGWDIAWYQR